MPTFGEFSTILSHEWLVKFIEHGANRHFQVTLDRIEIRVDECVRFSGLLDHNIIAADASMRRDRKPSSVACFTSPEP
jgi:hypothetical protein